MLNFEAIAFLPKTTTDQVFLILETLNCQHLACLVFFKRIEMMLF